MTYSQNTLLAQAALLLNTGGGGGSQPLVCGLGLSHFVTGGATPQSPLMIVAFGESNAGGTTNNTDAASWEILSRPELRMLNVNTGLLEDLDIGTNNNVDHFQLTSATHGWELHLANRLKRGWLGSRPVRYVQCGQGGSFVSQWNVGGAYWTKFLQRTRAAASLSPPSYRAVWVSLGINDAIAGLADTSYKTSMADILGRIIAEMPGAKVYVCGLPPVNATYDAYSARLQEIVAANPTTMRYVSSTSPYTMDMRDTNHWSYLGMKRLCSRLLDATIADFGGTPKSFAWPANVDAGWQIFSASAQNTVSTTTLDMTVDGSIQCDVATLSNGLVTFIDTDNVGRNWPNARNIIAGVFQFSNGFYYCTVLNGSTQVAGVTIPCLAKIAWTASNGNVTIETSHDGGTTWTVRATLAARALGVTTGYVKSLSSVSSCRMDIWKT